MRPRPNDPAGYQISFDNLGLERMTTVWESGKRSDRLLVGIKVDEIATQRRIEMDTEIVRPHLFVFRPLCTGGYRIYDGKKTTHERSMVGHTRKLSDQLSAHGGRSA